MKRAAPPAPPVQQSNIRWFGELQEQVAAMCETFSAIDRINDAYRRALRSKPGYDIAGRKL